MADDIADPPSEINPYKVLGVDEKTSASEIRSAYRKQALRHHPGEPRIAFSRHPPAPPN